MAALGIVTPTGVELEADLTTDEQLEDSLDDSSKLEQGTRSPIHKDM
ncbi:hypothetical protein [Sporisorium scitamineum]|uniref:Uncharacterized protein n=1 Tax=Sporisorium scitamineum TaxID=49012 RepID=A0A0F7RV29_9BASI|nr:hypothetical protein [Sporisorium scitamineum]